MSNLVPPPSVRTAATPARSPLRENVVVAGGGLVLFDYGERIEGERPEVIDTATHAEAVGAADRAVAVPGAVAAVGMVLGDRTVGDAEGAASASFSTDLRPSPSSWPRPK